METVLRLELSSETLDAMNKLCEITGATKGVGELIQDAVRTYEWIIHEQIGEKVVAAIPKSVSQGSLWTELVSKEVIDVLPPIFDLKKMEEAKKYFAKAAQMAVKLPALTPSQQERIGEMRVLSEEQEVRALGHLYKAFIAYLCVTLAY